MSIPSLEDVQAGFAETAALINLRLKISDAAAVATSGAYSDLTGKPTLFSGAYADLTGKPTLFSGAYADLTGKPTIPVKASGSEFRTGTDDAKFLTPKAVFDASAPVVLTDASTVSVDLATGQNFTLTLGGNRTLGAPTNAKAGQSGVITITQDGTGTRTLAYASAYKKPGGTLTLSTAAASVDVLSYYVEVGGGSPVIRINLAKAFS
jgi:hypothetical protein